MNSVAKVYRFFNLLSLDIAAGAIAGAYYFASLLQVEMRSYAIASLGLTVWIIYTTDHLLDARKVKGRASTERHRFHQDNFGLLTVLLIVAAAIDFILLFFIKKPVLYGGFFISAIVGLYLVLHDRLKFLKEIFVAVLYCAGILLPSLPVTSIALDLIHYALFFLFFTTALINLLMFAWFDRHHDYTDRHQSFVTVVGERQTVSLIWILFTINAVLCCYGLLYLHAAHAFLIPLLMNALLILIQGFHSWFAAHDRYRLLGDAVFLLPLGYLLM